MNPSKFDYLFNIYIYIYMYTNSIIWEDYKLLNLGVEILMILKNYEYM